MNILPYHTHSVRLHAFSPEQLQEIIQGGHFDHYILSQAKCDVHLDHWSMDDFAIDTGRYSFPVRIAGSFPARKLCIGYMRRLTAPTWVNGLIADDHTVEFYPEGTELNYRAAALGRWVSITFEESSLQAAAHEQLGHEIDLPWKHVVSFRLLPEQRNSLDRLIARLWRRPCDGAQMIRPILGFIAEMLDSLQRDSSSEVSRKCRQREQILQRSDDFLREQLAEPFDLSALAAATATTSRTLQRTFLEAYGVTPEHWARCHALHCVRGLLQSPAARIFTVEAIAHDCGFRHMGRFSAYYRELFGELPSLTISKPARELGSHD